jgi:hypothetical protein
MVPNKGWWGLSLDPKRVNDIPYPLPQILEWIDLLDQGDRLINFQ